MFLCLNRKVALVVQRIEREFAELVIEVRFFTRAQIKNDTAFAKTVPFFCLQKNKNFPSIQSTKASTSLRGIM